MGGSIPPAVLQHPPAAPYGAEPMPNVTLVVNTRRPFGRNWAGRRAITELIKWLQAVASGAVQSDALTYGSNDTSSLGDQSYAGHACAALVGSTLSGSVGGVIDGTSVTVTASGGDTATQTALAAAIRANSTVNRKVGATNIFTSVTLSTVLAGDTIRVLGVLFKAVNGTPADFGEFDMSGANAADATSLCLAINRHPSLAGRVRACVAMSTSTVCIFPIDGAPRAGVDTIGPASSSTLSISSNAFAAGTVTLVYALIPGDLGNCCTVTATGTGMSASSVNSGKLGGGTGGASSMQIVVP